MARGIVCRGSRKWASCDPLLWQRPAISPYLAFAASPIRFVDPDGKKPLVESDFKTLDDLKKEIPIVYTPRALKGTYLPQSGEFEYDYEPAYVTVSDPKAGSQYRNTLSEDTPSEAELQRIAGVEIGEQVMWGASHRDVLLYREDLEAVVKLSYAPKNSAGTALFYVAEEMSNNVQGDNPSRYINAFKHVFGQSVITTLRGRGAADLVGDIHEREFVSDVFATQEKQQQNLTSGFATQNKQPQPSEKELIDTYVDLINNTYGQDLGEQLRTDLGISRSTYWTPELTAEYLNAVQQYLGKELNLQLKAFEVDSDTVKKFANLINEVQMVETPPAEIERQQYEVLGMPH